MIPFQDPEWQAELDRIAPPSPKLSFLHCYYEVGYAWEPVDRWMIGQVIPSLSIATSVRELLDGPNPADHGHFEQDDYGHPRWVTDLPGVSRRQWRFYQDTGNYLRPYWVVQGSNGGHRYQWNFAERRIIAMNGGNPEAPYPGQLPYAVPDRRTFAEIGKADMLRRHAYAVDYMEKEQTKKRLEDYETRGLEEMRKMVWAAIGEQVKGYSSELEFHMRGDLGDLPRDKTPYDKKLEELEHSFIKEG